jgi:hypothetical protein
MATLVYNLDANNDASYPGAGDKWYDVSGNTYSADPTMTLVNGPTFINAGGFRYLKFTKAAFQYGQFALAAQAAGDYPTTTLAYRIYSRSLGYGSWAPQSFSVAMWVRLDSAPTAGSVSGGSSGTGVNPQCLTTMQYRHEVGVDNLAPRIYFTSDGGWVQNWEGTNTSPVAQLPVGDWKHVVAVYEAAGSVFGTMYLYVDGELAGIAARLTGGGFGTDAYQFSNALAVYLNHSWNRPAPYPSAPPDSTVGDISVNSYQIYQGALTAEEVLTLFGGGYSIPEPSAPAEQSKPRFVTELGLPPSIQQDSVPQLRQAMNKVIRALRVFNGETGEVSIANPQVVTDNIRSVTRSGVDGVEINAPGSGVDEYVVKLGPADVFVLPEAPQQDAPNGSLALRTDTGGVYAMKSGAWTELGSGSGSGSGSGTVTSVGVSGGSTGLTTSGGPVTSAGTITLDGTLAVANGGTGQTTASAALNALLPAQATNSGKVLSTNGTSASWAVAATGTVTSVDVSGGTTGLTVSGGPVTSSGTITLAGTLGITNGGTGQTTADTALNALLPAQATNNGKVLSTNGTSASWAVAATGTVTSVDWRADFSCRLSGHCIRNASSDGCWDFGRYSLFFVSKYLGLIGCTSNRLPSHRRRRGRGPDNHWPDLLHPVYRAIICLRVQWERGVLKQCICRRFIHYAERADHRQQHFIIYGLPNMDNYWHHR